MFKPKWYSNRQMVVELYESYMCVVFANEHQQSVFDGRLDAPKPKYQLFRGFVLPENEITHIFNDKQQDY